MKLKILFLCTHNSARSQMAEGLVNHFLKERYIAESAGSQPTKINPLVIKVMKEIGVDISHQQAKHASQFTEQSFDYVVTVCDNAKESCPFFPYASHFIHRNFQDPSQVEGTEEKKLEAFRKIRDEINKWIKGPNFLS